MNRNILILRHIAEHKDYSQRELAKELGCSLGTVNHIIKELLEDGFLIFDEHNKPSYGLSTSGVNYLNQYKVDGALITAAGFGSRFVPLTFEMPKGLLEVFGERMIERQIRQLHEVGIFDITIAVGYLKEKFEYLIDKYQVKLLYNPEYSTKNTLTTIYRAMDVLRGKNMYVLSSDNWMRENMFHTWEPNSWYASTFMEGNTSEWVLQTNKKGRIQNSTIGGKDAWVMYGPVFFQKEFSDKFLPYIEEAYQTPGTEQFYWENILMQHFNELEMYINQQPPNQIYEFENLEELRLFDPKYQNHSDNEALQLIAKVFQVSESAITQIQCLKAGMTNQSFLFQLENKPYICRIAGNGTEVLINRSQESAVYDAIEHLDLSEHVIYFDKSNGYKISHYYEGAKNADAKNWEDMSLCMEKLRMLHKAKLSVPHTFDIGERIDFYESLCLNHGGTLFEDYGEVRTLISNLIAWVNEKDRPHILCHIDGNADNFILLPNGTIRLIDWEYSGMSDPLLDIAMCAIYSYYSKEEADRLLCLYLQRTPNAEEEAIYYAYMALGGFLWCLWAIYKASFGEEFGEYTLIMYRYAKKYAKLLL